MSIKTINFDTVIYDDEDNEIKVCVEAQIEKGYPKSFNPCRECWDAPADDDIEITEIYNYETKSTMDLNNINKQTLERLEEEATNECDY